jgi:hypothetical protein
MRRTLQVKKFEERKKHRASRLPFAPLDGHSALDYLSSMPRPNKESENRSMRNVGRRFTRPPQLTGTDGAKARQLDVRKDK